MGGLFGKPKAQKVSTPPMPEVTATPTEAEKDKKEMDEARRRRSSLAKTLLTTGDTEDKLKNKLGQ